MKIESPFSIDNDEFRFSLVFESRSLEAHSLMSSANNKEELEDVLKFLQNTTNLIELLIKQRKIWKEKHK